MLWELLKELSFILFYPKKSRFVARFKSNPNSSGFDTLSLRLTILVLVLTLLVSIPHTVGIIHMRETNPQTRDFMSTALGIMVELVPAVLFLLVFHMTSLDKKHRIAMAFLSAPFVVLVLIIQLEYYNSASYKVPGELLAGILPYSVLVLSYALAVILPHIKKGTEQVRNYLEEIELLKKQVTESSDRADQLTRKLANNQATLQDQENRLVVARELQNQHETERVQFQEHISGLENYIRQLEQSLTGANEARQAALSQLEAARKERELPSVTYSAPRRLQTPAFIATSEDDSWKEQALALAEQNVPVAQIASQLGKARTTVSSFLTRNKKGEQE